MLEIMKFMLEQNLIETKPECNKRSYIALAPQVQKSASDKRPGMPVYCNSLKGLEKQVHQNVYWTPNSFYRKNRCKADLRYLNTICIDIDEVGYILDDVLGLINDAGLPVPTLVLKSPSGGWHIFWAIEPGAATPKAIILYEAVTKAVATVMKSDPLAVGAERYFRLPTRDNIAFFQPFRYTLNEFREWRDSEFTPYYPEVKKITNNTGKVGFIKKGILSTPAFLYFLGGVPKGKRDHVAFTLALAFMVEGYTREQTLDYLLNEWNPKNEVPLSYNELAPRVKSAYSGKWRGPRKDYIEDLSGIKFSWRPITPRVPDEERKYKRNTDIQLKLIDYLTNQGGRVKVSLRSLASSLDVSLTSLKRAIETLIKDLKIVTGVTGIGRKAITTIALMSFFQNVVALVNFNVSKPYTTSSPGLCPSSVDKLVLGLRASPRNTS